jgi:hypothetical protein
MPIDFSNLSAEDIAAATAAVEAARRAHEEKERWEAEEWQKRQEEERARQEAIMQREAEQRKEGAARKVEVERRDRLAREKAAREAAAAKMAATVTTGLSGLKLTIPAPASIVHTASRLSTQSKGKRKVRKRSYPLLSASHLFRFRSLLTFSRGRGFHCVTRAQSSASLVRQSYGRTVCGGHRAIGAIS